MPDNQARETALLTGAAGSPTIWLDPPKDTALGISLVLGLPADLLDLWITGRVVIFLPAVILLRAFTEFFLAGSPATPGRPWTDTLVSIAYFVLFPPHCLLIAAAVLLQWSKLNPRALIFTERD